MKSLTKGTYTRNFIVWYSDKVFDPINPIKTYFSRTQCTMDEGYVVKIFLFIDFDPSRHFGMLLY